MENKFDLAVAVHNPGEELQKALGEIHAQKMEDSSYFFVYDSEKESDYDSITDIGEEDLNATLSLGLYNSRDNMFYPSDVLTEKLASQGGVDANSISVDFLDSIDPTEYDEEIKEEVTRIQREYYASDAMKSERVEQQKKVMEQNSQDNEASNEKENSNILTDSQDTDEDLSESKGEDKLQENTEPDQESSVPQDISPEEDKGNLYDEAEIDPLLSMAAERLKNECTTQIPIFDPHTSEQIRPQLAEAYKNISQFQDETIYAIYQKLQKKRDKFQREFEEKFKTNAETHEHTMKVISDNETEQIKNIKEKSKKKYGEDREEFIKNQRPVLEVKFDSEHKAEYDNDLQNRINEVHLEAQNRREQEESHYEEFRAEQEDDYLNNRLQKVDISDEVNDLEEKIQRQINHIMEASQDFADQVATVTKSIEEDKNQAVEKYKQAQNILDTYKETFDSRLKEGIAKGVNDQMHDINQKLRKSDEVNSHQRQKINEMSQHFSDEKQQDARKHADELDARDKKWRAELEDQRKKDDAKYQEERANHEADNHEKDKKIKDLQNEVDNSKKAEKKLRDLVKDLQLKEFKNGNGNDGFSYQPQALSAQYQQQKQPNVQQISTEEKTKEHRKNKSKMGVGTKIALGIMGIATLGSVGFGAYVSGTTNAKNANTDVQVQSQSQPQAASSIASSSSNTQQSSQSTQFKKGDTWVYSPAPNQKYTVTMDSPTQGHYTNAQGITKTIVISGNTQN